MFCVVSYHFSLNIYNKKLNFASLFITNRNATNFFLQTPGQFQTALDLRSSFVINPAQYIALFSQKHNKFWVYPLDYAYFKHIWKKTNNVFYSVTFPPFIICPKENEVGLFLKFYSLEYNESPWKHSRLECRKKKTSLKLKFKLILSSGTAANPSAINKDSVTAATKDKIAIIHTPRVNKRLRAAVPKEQNSLFWSYFSTKNSHLVWFAFTHSFLRSESNSEQIKLPGIIPYR